MLIGGRRDMLIVVAVHIARLARLVAAIDIGATGSTIAAIDIVAVRGAVAAIHRVAVDRCSAIAVATTLAVAIHTGFTTPVIRFVTIVNRG